jgi:hypothetical protein
MRADRGNKLNKLVPGKGGLGGREAEQGSKSGKKKAQAARLVVARLGSSYCPDTEICCH